nr:hypothetical protein [Rufibacter roseus]
MEYSPGDDNDIISEHDIVLNEGLTIQINKVKTDNYSKLYNSISNIHLPVTALDVRKVQNVVKEIYAGGEIKVSITEDLDTLRNGDKILAIGSTKTISYHYETSAELLSNYFKIIDESNYQILFLIDKYKIQAAQYFPIFGFSKINSQIQSIEKLKEQQVKNIDECLKNIKPASQKTHITVTDILADETIPSSYKTSSIIWNTFYRNIPLELTESYLRETSSNPTTDYRKILSIYDWVKYSSETQDLGTESDIIQGTSFNSAVTPI